MRDRETTACPRAPGLTSLLAACVAICVPPGFGAEGDFGSVQARFAVITTVAGNGADDDGNEWDADNEGRPAVEVDLSRPHMTVADPWGNLYIADKEAHAIRLVKLDGTIHTIAGTGADGFDGDGVAAERRLSNPNGLVRLPNGALYILDLTNQRIRRIDPDGTLSTVVHDETLIIGRGLWVSASEDLIYYASGSEVRRWRRGVGVDTYAGGFVDLGNLDVDLQGRLAVTDRGDHVVVRIGLDGQREVIAGNGTSAGGGSGQPAVETGLEEVRGIAFDAEGGYFLCTHRSGQVWYVDPGGIIHLFIDGGSDDSTHSGDGTLVSDPGRKISEPRAVALSPAGDLIVTENDRGFVRLIERRDTPVRFVGLETLDGGSFRIRFRTVVGVSYRAEESGDLRSWTAADPFVATSRISEWEAEGSATGSYLRLVSLGIPSP